MPLGARNEQRCCRVLDCPEISVTRGSWPCRSTVVVAVVVIDMVIEDVRAVVAALADQETLYVFGVLATRTTKLGRPPARSWHPTR